MSIRTMRFSLGILFLFLAGVIFGRGWLFPEFAAQYDSLRMNMGGVFALVFGCLNLARWYAATQFIKSSQTAVRYPLQPDPSVVPPVEPIPEFDFTNQPDAEKVEEQRKAEKRQ